MKRTRSIFAITLAAVVAGCALPSARAFADEVNASYTTGAEVPIRSDNFTADGKEVRVALNFAPAKAQDLTLVRSTGSGFIRGKFSNLAQGQLVTLQYQGVAYHFVANYYGGSGRDLVLMAINLDDLSLAAQQKLDNQLVLVLKRSRGQAPFDRPAPPRPEDYERGGRVLVDVHAAVSIDLTNQIAQAGGEVIKGWQTATALRAWVPFSQLEAIANLPAIQSISAARPSITRRLVR